MSTRPRTDSRSEPAWQRLAAGAPVLFLVIVASSWGACGAGRTPGIASASVGPAHRRRMRAHLRAQL